MARFKKDDKPKGPKNREEMLAKYGSLNKPKILTDIISLDMALGDGFERGDMIEVYGPSGTGKTTMLLHMAKNFCTKGMSVLYIDVERGVKQKTLDNIGLTEHLDKSFSLVFCTTYVELEEILEVTLYAEAPPDVIILDSITSVLPSKMLTKGIEDVEIGLEARMASNFVKTIKGCLRTIGTTLFMINQVRTKIDIIKGASEESAGGNAVKFYCDIRLQIRPGAQLKRPEQTAFGEQEIVYGNMGHLTAIKNRADRSHIPITVYIIFGRGVSNFLTLRDLLTGNGLVTGGRGGFFKCTIPGLPEASPRGTDALLDYIRLNKTEIYNYLHKNGFLQLVRTPDREPSAPAENIMDSDVEKVEEEGNE